MIPLKPLSGQVLAYFRVVLFARFALAGLQNTTVDDAVLTGPVVPQYLPSQSQWNIGNNCTVCLVRPDPSLAYNGTWHDTTYSPNNGYTQGIEFTFTGSALYIFFIIANSVPYATTLTYVEFELDTGVAVSTYMHTPGTTTDYQYNVPVYVNESLSFGQHSMMIQPINSGNNVLMLFDYLIYTTDTSSSESSDTSSSPSTPTASTSPPASATSTGTQGTTSGQNTGAIVGAVCGGLVLVFICLLCYRRYKRRNDGRPEEGPPVVGPFYSSVEMAPISLPSTRSSINPLGSPFAELASATNPSIVTRQLSIPPTSTTATFSSSGAAPGVLEEVERLRAEVARLRGLHEAFPGHL